MTRVYVPTTLALLRDGWATGSIVPGSEPYVADADDEVSEYSALMAAADDSAALLGGPGRRVVLVAEVTDPAAPIAVRDVVALHADPVERPAGADPDDDLAWYATQEIPDLLDAG